MKSRIIILLNLICLCMPFVVLSQTQSQAENLKKYWYYRWRLQNDFVDIGEGQGKSIVANERRYNDVPDLNFGDEMITQGYYLAVLATEYKLLQDNNQDLTNTTKELFYALEAINRVDYYAETYYQDVNAVIGQPSLNGFFIRGDVPVDFICNVNYNNCLSGNTTRYDKFNSGLIKYPPLSDPGQANFKNVDNIAFKIFLNDTNNVSECAKADAGKFNPPLYPNVLMNKVYCPSEMTIDQVYPLIMGLAMVTKFIPFTERYFENGSVKSFLDGETFIRTEAQKIIERVTNWVKTSNNNSWTIKNPITGKGVVGLWDKGYVNNNILDTKTGANALWAAYGLAEAACNAYYSSSSPTYNYFGQFFNCPKFHNILSQLNRYLWDCFNQNSSCTLPLYLNETEKIMFMASVGDSWYTGNVFNLIRKNNTAVNLSFRAQLKNFEHFPLIHQALHGGGNAFIPNSYYEGLLDKAPCTGPYNFNDGIYPDYEWSTSNRWQHPDRRGANTSVNPNDHLFVGFYSGLDYMLLHNLYYIVAGSSANITLPAYQHYIDRSFSIPFPILSANIGSTSNPITVGAFNTLTYSGTLASNSAVTFRAGVEITLKPGCEMLAGTESHCVIEPYNCSSISMDFTNMRKSGGGFIEGNTYGEMGILPDTNKYIASVKNYSYGEIQKDFNIDAENNTNEVKFGNDIALFPNPTNNNYHIVFSLSKISTVEINLTDLNGRIIKQLTSQKYAEGFHELSSDASELTNGIYLIQFKSSELNKVIKLVVNK